jgi:hypothetical protein
MVLEKAARIIKPTVDTWVQLVINNEKLMRGLLLSTLGFANSLLKIYTDIWLRSYYKELYKQSKNYR